jgi:tyrosine-protein kinase Etk/Wzc
VKKNKNVSIIEVEDLKVIGRVAIKNWYVFLIAIIVSLLANYFYTYKLTNVYSAQAQILLVPKNQQINEQSLISDNYGSYGAWNQSTIDNTTEMRIIQSYDLIESVVERMKLEVVYFIKGRIKTTEVYGAIPFSVLVDKVNPTVYGAKIQLKILSKQKYKLVLSKDGEDFTKYGEFDKELVDADFKILIKNNAISDVNVKGLMSVNYFFEIRTNSDLVNTIQNSLSVENPENTTILQLKLEDVIPERAKSILDTLTSVYIENSVKARLDLNSNTLKYIDKQMAEITDILDGIEDTIQENYFSKMNELDANKTKLKLQLEALTSLGNYIIEGKDPQFLPPAIYVVGDDAFLKQNVEELYTLQMQVIEKLNGSTEASFNVKSITQRIDKLKNILLTYINNSGNAMKKNIAELNSQIESYVGSIKTIPKKQRDLLNIERNLDVNQKMYLFLLEKKSNTIISRAAILPQNKVIEAARSFGIVSPNKQKIRLTFLGIALIISFIIFFIRSNFFYKIESIDELKALTNLPILGEIIHSPSGENWAIAVEKESKADMAESFRTIRTNLQYLSPGSGSKTIVVTSNNPNEGKTFTAINIAAIFAKAGKKVLILELDLHKPKVQKALNLVADMGISTIVIGEKSIEECIKKTNIENMFALLSGPVPPNPSEMILSKPMEEIMDYGKNNFDYVIIDTPPVGLISDAIVLLNYADVCLFVLNTKLATKDSVNIAHEIVELNNLKHFGFILNGVKRKRAKYSYNKYGYEYYGYGYGKKVKDKG